MTARVGPKHAKIPARAANWHGTATGPVVLGGRQVSVSRPRGRSIDGSEIELESWQAFSSRDLLDRLTVERMLAGVATRRHVDVGEPLSSAVEAEAKATGRSSVSRRFKRATEAALAELMARDLSGLEVAVIMIDGLEVAGQCVVVALAITADGTKIPVGLWLGDTENKTVVTGLLADLAARGLSGDGGLLAVLDGAKALAAGVKKVFGDKARIQRCTLHKRRNVKGYLPKELGSKIDWRLARAFADTDPAKGLDQAKRIAGELTADHPDAAASLLEGLEEMFTTRRLASTAGWPPLDQHQLHRVHDLRGPHHHGQRQELEGRLHEETLGGRRHDRSRTELPARPRLPGHAHPRRRSTTPHPDRHTRQLQSGRCLINAVATAKLQQKAGHPRHIVPDTGAR